MGTRTPEVERAMLQNKLYVGIVNVPGYGVVGKRGDFDPLIPDEVFLSSSGDPDRTSAHDGPIPAPSP